jgi:hypothetical protein
MLPKLGKAITTKRSSLHIQPNELFLPSIARASHSSKDEIGGKEAMALYLVFPHAFLA